MTAATALYVSTSFLSWRSFASVILKEGVIHRVVKYDCMKKKVERGPITIRDEDKMT